MGRIKDAGSDRPTSLLVGSPWTESAPNNINKVKVKVKEQG